MSFFILDGSFIGPFRSEGKSPRNGDGIVVKRHDGHFCIEGTRCDMYQALPGFQRGEWMGGIVAKIDLVTN